MKIFQRPDGLTLTAWKNGKNLIWDATVADILCQSYINQSSKVAGAAADSREDAKIKKYSDLAENTVLSLWVLNHWDLGDKKATS